MGFLLPLLQFLEGSDMLQIAFYKAPGTWADKAIRLVTGSIYSHCELVINGVCYSASAREDKVRAKAMYLDPARWDVLALDGAADQALAWFSAQDGHRYDWAGVARFVLPFLPHSRNRWFCSEACAAALGIPQPHQFSPGGLHKHVTARGSLQAISTQKDAP
jgi:hypothetical protein